MLKRTETALVFDENGNHLEKHVFEFPGTGVYEPAEDSWVKKDGEAVYPSRIYSYAGGTVILPWSKQDDKWKADSAISIISGGVEVDPGLISGDPKERIRLITHQRNVILVVTWPEPLSHTFFIFDSFGRQLTTSLHKWSLGDYPPTPFCQSIIGPKLNISTGGIDIQIEKGNKLTTVISFMLPSQDNEKPVLMVYEL